MVQIYHDISDINIPGRRDFGWNFESHGQKNQNVFVFFLPDCSGVEFPLTVLSKNECASRQIYFIIIAVKISQFCVLEFVCARRMG